MQVFCTLTRDQAEYGSFRSKARALSTILLVNGPNLNLLGIREPSVYGHVTLESLELDLTTTAKAMGHELLCFQSNHEGSLIDRLQQAHREDVDFILINPGGYGHTSIALRDALLGVAIPFLEIHLSNIYARERFRHHSYLSDTAAGVIVGLGVDGYRLALHGAHALLQRQA